MGKRFLMYDPICILLLKDFMQLWRIMNVNMFSSCQESVNVCMYSCLYVLVLCVILYINMLMKLFWSSWQCLVLFSRWCSSDDWHHGHCYNDSQMHKWSFVLTPCPARVLLVLLIVHSLSFSAWVQSTCAQHLLWTCALCEVFVHSLLNQMFSYKKQFFTAMCQAVMNLTQCCPNFLTQWPTGHQTIYSWSHGPLY